MKKLLLCIVAVLFIGSTPLLLHARGGGGCLVQGTPVLTPSGQVAIENLQPGDTVLGVDGRSLLPVNVQAVTQVRPDAFYEIVVDRHALRITAEHPIETAPGVFRIASVLHPGNTVLVTDRGMIRSSTIKSILRKPADLTAYNLLVAPIGTYVADGVVAHNKGCFLPETLIQQADGTAVPLSHVQPHDRILAFTSDGTVVNTTVRSILTHEAEEYRVVATEKMVLNVTPEHPFYVGSGMFKTLDALQTGDEIFAFDGTGLSRQRIATIETIRKKTIVYNLQTDAPHTFFANGAAVHNKGGGGGCFAAGTKILTPKGEVGIEGIEAGSYVIAIDQNNQPVAALVKQTHKTRSPILVLTTRQGNLTTTVEHPLRMSSGGFRPAGVLSRGDEILIWQQGKTRSTAITALERTKGEHNVYNLTVEWPHTFVADGFIVHNKGGGGSHGGGGYHSSGSGSGGSPTPAFFVLGGFAILFVIVYRKQQAGQDLDFIYTRSQIAKKRDKTVKLLAFIAKQDPAADPEILRTLVESTFLKLQACWQTRTYGPMKPLLMPDLYQAHLLQIQGMVSNHEINVIADLRIDAIDLVNVRYTLKENQREFTALITATARDYYIDDRTRDRLRGDTTPAKFQEFWTFHFVNKAWLLREIEQTKESDILKDENFIEQFTDKGVDHIYGDSASKPGPAGPGLEKEVEAKENRIERMLNFLVTTDKLWDRQAMLLISRNVFLKVTVAWESNDPSKVPTADLFPEMAADLKEEIAKLHDAGITLEFRNLCVRKVELILIRNFADNSKDEFIARVRAHAQKKMRKNGVVLRQDDDVTPYEQYLTFGKSGAHWKLKELLNAEAARGLVARENLDQDSTGPQLQWYYQHKRAL